MKTRRAVPGDADAIAALYLQLKRHHSALAPATPRYEMPDHRWVEYTREGLASSHARFYVAERGPDVIAFMKLLFEEKTWGRACEVETLVVDEQVRGQGIGRAMMKRAEEIARQEGARGMRVNVLHVNQDGRRFYQQEGYRTIAVRYGKPL